MMKPCDLGLEPDVFCDPEGHPVGLKEHTVHMETCGMSILGSVSLLTFTFLVFTSEVTYTKCCRSASTW